MKDKMRHQAQAHGAPDHLINSMARLLEGEKIESKEIPRHAKDVYESQNKIGWDHFRRGRISKEWSKVKTTDSRGDKRPDERWRTGIARVILQWTLQKWLLRCDLAKSPEAEFNHGLVLETCKDWWRQRREKRPMRGDLHLARGENEPREIHSIEYLKGRIQTRELAERAFRRYEPGRNQPTLHKWLVRREG